ncbi:MAG TPA: glycoside hydrolase family 3 N-terminal domain-containing protein [Lachnospiraceae bacterium]|nr:glycoside hydrolase family 3 N-terminal domain-containing protein [Lachnospiraceae bacterium]
MVESTNLNTESKITQNSDVDQKRDERRKRRKRNQILVYLAMGSFVVILISLVLVSVYYLSQKEKLKPGTDTSVSENIVGIIGTEESLVKPDESEMVQELTPKEKLDEIINAAIEVMPMEDKVAGLFMVTPEAITKVSNAVQAGDGTREALSNWAVGGIVYFKKNMKTTEQLTEMISNTSLYSRYPLFIGVDEEGGEVSRVAEAGLAENVGSASSIGQTQDPAEAYATGQNIAAYLTSLGFNMDFAPVADLNNIEDSIIGDRSYGRDSSVVSSMVTSMVQGLEENGISSCLKHFPGVGNSVKDTHIGMASTDKTAEQFRTEDFVAFQAGMNAGADFVMVSHLSVPAFTGDNTPCTLSKAVVTDILREELGYDGIVITDAMNMSAITEYYATDEAAILALKAGCDMILMPDDFETAYNGVLQAVQNGTISEERINDSLRRIYRVKYADKLPE